MARSPGLMETTSLRVGVVGAGPAGLCAARHCHASGMDCTVFEQTGDIGGTWQYTDCVGTDQYGIPVHTSMYRDLRTNLPKEVIMFPGTPYRNTTESYITSEEVLQYLADYADKFQLRDLCKFYHHVERVSRTGGEWEVTVVDLPASQRQVYRFDALFICNGLNNKPMTPHLEGAEGFTGTMIHSHDFRSPEPFREQRVLIIGGGLSALDLMCHIPKVADKVWFSHHSEMIKWETLKLGEEVGYKPDVRSLGTHSAVFQDGSEEEVDAVIFCTGFRCNYAFLDESCGVTEDDGMVYPLYKHFINANQTTMCILGNLCYSMQLPTFDIQVRVFVKSLTENVLPGRDHMLQEIEEYTKKKLANGARKKAFFTSTADEDAVYYESLASMARIEPLPKVLTRVHGRAILEIYQNFPSYRENKFNIIDDESFEVFSSS